MDFHTKTLSPGLPQKESEQTGLVDGWKVPSTTYWFYADERIYIWIET